MTDTLYTPQIREFIRTRKWPKGINLSVHEEVDPAPHLNIVFYRDNWITLTFEEQQQAVSVTKEIMHKLHLDGVRAYVAKMEGTGSV